MCILQARASVSEHMQKSCRYVSHAVGLHSVDTQLHVDIRQIVGKSKPPATTRRKVIILQAASCYCHAS